MSAKPSKRTFTVKELKTRLDEDELDMTMLQLDTVPVKELSQLKKATKLDLSCNYLQVLTPEFAPQLSHLVRLDLSDNRLRELPDNFGELASLQHLDLYKNRLESLPVSMSKMKQLRWLDLKDNPLEPELTKVVGDCLDEKQCKTAANRLVQHMHNQQACIEREKQKRLDREREIARERKAAEDAQQREKQLAKKREKDRKRQENRSKHSARSAKQDETQKHDYEMNGDATGHKKSPRKTSTDSESSKTLPWSKRFMNCAFYLLSILMSLLFGTLLFLAILAAVFYQNCTSHETWLPQSQPLCHDLLSWSKNGKMPKDTQQHAQLFVDGLREFTSEKVQQAYKYDYAAKFEETKQNAVWLSGKAKEKSKELYNEASVWYEKELGPKARNAGKELRIKADWLWAESKVAARYVANKSYDMIQQTILIVSKAVRWASETGNEIYTNREQYWQYACDLSNYYWKQAKYYWENVV